MTISLSIIALQYMPYEDPVLCRGSAHLSPLQGAIPPAVSPLTAALSSIKRIDTIPWTTSYLAVTKAKPTTPESVEKWEVQLRRGSLELAILAALWEDRLYGLEILRHLEHNSDLVVEGTVSPCSIGCARSNWWTPNGSSPNPDIRAGITGSPRPGGNGPWR
jgi:hypothetical protein